MPIDLRSDTVTRPTLAMKKAMLEAAVGDDVFGDDPTVNHLEHTAAARLGKEAALFVPSGTMANQIAIAVQTRPGDEVLLEAGSHPFNYEAGGAAVISGVQISPIPGVQGILDPAAVLAAIRPPNLHHAPAALLCVEDTHNRGGGTFHPIERLDELAAVARRSGLRAHLDGARLFNAAVASGTSVDRRAQGFDTVSFCLSKGLGCPVGSVLCGPRPLIEHARRVRKLLGGGMRQVGFLAAAGLYALESHVQRLADDHARARELAMGLLLAGFDVKLPQTNLVYVDLGDAQAAASALRALDVWTHPVSATRMRLVTHLDIVDADIPKVLAAFDKLPSAVRAVARPTPARG